MVRVALGLALAAGVSRNAWAEGPAPAASRADEAFQAGRWSDASEIYEGITSREPGNGEAWFRLGISRRKLKRYDPAAHALERASAAGFSAVQTLGALAITRAEQGERERAFETLTRAVDAGLPVSVLETHPGLEPLRADARFAGIRAAADRKSHPCEREPRYAALDFWLGDWDVYRAGQRVGHNRILKAERGCVVLESWTDSSGGTGRSLNYLDPATGRWRQNYVDENGGVVWYEGEVRDGALRFLGENVGADGKSRRARVVLTPRSDGTVHHLIEHSDDGGKTWHGYFDAEYRRVGAAK